MPQDRFARFADYNIRDGWINSQLKLKIKKTFNVAFIGGSVTAGSGASDANKTSYRALTYRYLEHRFPQVSFNFINAAIGGTDSTYGAFRLKNHVFGHGSVDLLFVEFAVNDSGQRIQSIRAMEGIIRNARRMNAQIDICFIYLANHSGAKHFSMYGTPQSNILHHEEIAGHYRIPSVQIASEMYRMIESNTLQWGEVSGDEVHPNDFGYSLYARFLQHFLEEALRTEDAIQTEAAEALVPPEAAESSLLPLPMDPLCYEKADLLSPQNLDHGPGWGMVNSWTTEKTCNWKPPADILVGEAPGADCRIHFKGTAIGISLLVGMDTGNLDYSIDGEAYRTAELFDRYCLQFYRPKIYLFADDLIPGDHIIDMKISEKKHEQSTGHAVRIMNILVNE